MRHYTRSDPLLMIPGPTPLSDRVVAALAAPLRGHGSAENTASLRRIREGLCSLTGMADGEVWVLPGSGTLAMEAAVVNHITAGERVVLVNHGYFSERFVDVCAVHGIEVEQVRARWGQRADLGEVRALISHGEPPAWLIVTHVDTSTGVSAPVEELAAMARDAGAMVLLDGVCATGGVPEDLDALGVDVLVTASQKALAAPPGLAIIVASARARERRTRIGTPRSFYLDLARWAPAMSSTAYFATHATGLVRALDVSIDEMRTEGLAQRYRRHREVADLARQGFRELGFTLLTAEEALAPTLSVIRPPDGVDEAALRAALLDGGILVAAGIGEFAGVGIRVGHMGTAGREEVGLTLEALERVVARTVHR